MDNGGSNPPANGQTQKELSVALAASSMINASDMIDAEAYQANAQRIQEVKEMVQRLEYNNDAAHRNFLVDQLEKRAKEGREAESMLAELSSQPRLPVTVRFSNNVPSGNMLPTTATLVEVPDSHPSPSRSSLAPPITSYRPQSAQQSRPAPYQWSSPQIQPYHSNVFSHYVPPNTTHASFQHGAAPYTQAPGDMGHRYATQYPPPRPRVHNPSTQAGFQPMQAQHPMRSWITSYAPQVAISATASAGESSKTAPVSSAPGPSSSNPIHHGLGVSTQSVTSRLPSTLHNQPLNSTARVPVPFQSVPAAPTKPLAQTPIGSYSKPPESQSQPTPTTVSNQVATWEQQQPHELPEQLQQHRRQPQSQRLSTPQLQPQQHQSQPLQPQIQLQSRGRQSQQLLQPPQSHQQLPPPPADRVPSTNASQVHTQPQSINVQEQSWQRGTQVQQVDQATFIKHFHNAVKRGGLHLKNFWFSAKAAGISDEWFRLATNSLPRNVLIAAITQANQSGPALDTMPSTNGSQQKVLMVPSLNGPVVGTVSPPIAAPGQMTSTLQRTTESSISSEGDSTSRPYDELYAPQLRYYAEQATKSAHLAQTLGISTFEGNVIPTRTTVTIPKRDAAPHITANVRTPKDANKSTLARDVLRALGKIAPKPSQEMGGKPTDEAHDYEGDRLAEVNISQSTCLPAAAEPPAILLEPVSVEANATSTSSVEPNTQDVPQSDPPPCQSVVKPVLKAEPGRPAVDKEPIMIDLTLDSPDGAMEEANFLIQTSTNAAISPVSPINATNDTALPENLPLDEPPVPVAGDGDNADIRMRSPALTMGAEEKTDSVVVYPSPGTVEPLSQDFGPLPGENNEDELDGRLPLFLPSPPTSPAPTEPPVTDFEEDESRPPLKRRSVDVSKMGIDKETETASRVIKRRRQRAYVLIPPAPLYVKRAKMKGYVVVEGRDLDSEGVEQDEELRYSGLEQLLIEESKSRLLERQCLWSNCGAILNSATHLLAHLKNHASEEASETLFICRWTGCERQFGTEPERDVHLERHATNPLPCSFAGCDKQFDKPVEAMQHEVQHQKTERRERLVRKPTCEPVVPAIPARLGLPPDWLPSHRVIPRRVVKCQISADRHVVVGPWVLWNIFSPVDLSRRKQNGSMRNRPTRQTSEYDMDSLERRRDDYDFLASISPPCIKEAPFEDLDSGAITMSAARGLTLWGSGTVDTGLESHDESSVERMLEGN